MLGLLVTLIILLAIAGVLWWAITNLGLPEPVRIVAITIVAIVCLIVLLSLLPGVGLHWPPATR